MSGEDYRKGQCGEGVRNSSTLRSALAERGCQAPGVRIQDLMFLAMVPELLPRDWPSVPGTYSLNTTIFLVTCCWRVHGNSFPACTASLTK